MNVTNTPYSKPPKDNHLDAFLTHLKAFWRPVAGFLAAVTAVVSFIKLWQGDPHVVFWVTLGVGISGLIIGLGYIIFNNETTETGILRSNGKPQTRPRYSRQQKRWAKIGMLNLLLAGVAGIGLLRHHHNQLAQQYTLVVAQFDGPEDQYGLRAELLEQLRAAFADEPNVRIVALNEAITAGEGSAYARQVGEKYLADLVLWGWYRPTKNPRLTLHIENLADQSTHTYLEGTLQKNSVILRPAATLSDLDSFTLQIGSYAS